MAELLHRLILFGTVVIIALHFPELISWNRLCRKTAAPDEGDILQILALLRGILRLAFFFSIVLLAYALYYPAPSRLLVYPVVLYRLAALIIGERNLPAEIPANHTLERFVRLLMVADVACLASFAVIALQLHGVVTF
jgi:hypothetical protein